MKLKLRCKQLQRDEGEATVEATAKKREEKKPEKTPVSSKDIRSMLGTAEVIEIG